MKTSHVVVGGMYYNNVEVSCRSEGTNDSNINNPCCVMPDAGAHNITRCMLHHIQYDGGTNCHTLLQDHTHGTVLLYLEGGRS